MASLTGLFSRGSSYYLRIVLPRNHPATSRYRSGRIVLSLGSLSRREAVTKGTLLRAEILRADANVATPELARVTSAVARSVFAPAVELQPIFLRDVFTEWMQAKPRSADSVAACRRALAFYEQQTGNPPLTTLTRAAGVAFRSWLQQAERGTTAKTARDRLTWVKSLLKHAQIELEVIPRSPWAGLDIDRTTTHKRRPWTSDELATLFGQPLHTSYALPTDIKAGADAAYWIPLLGLFTGARVSELVQLRRADIELAGGVWVMSVTDTGRNQKVKTAASVRKVPLHSELLRLGLIEYVQRARTVSNDRLWPLLPIREGKSGGFFSQWFGMYRRELGFGMYPDFHCLRHTVRSALAEADVAEPMIDALVGHEVRGSTGARVYTHRTLTQTKTAVERITYPGLSLARVYPAA